MKVRDLKHKQFSTVGKRCKSFEWHCATCEMYRFKDLFGRFATDFDEVWKWAAPYRAEADLLEDA